MLDHALNATRFFRNESCGKCVPCRIGSQKLVLIAERTRERPVGAEELARDKALVDELLKTLELTSICGLGCRRPSRWPRCSSRSGKTSGFADRSVD